MIIKKLCNYYYCNNNNNVNNYNNYNYYYLMDK